MQPMTVTVTFGTPAQHASSPIAFDSLELAISHIRQVFDRIHTAPILLVEIKPGDHEPKLIGGEWVWPNTAA
jgi:hypothetical protein